MLPPPLYDVVRTDDHGNEFVIKENLIEREAKALVKLMTEKGHKQTYTMRIKKPKGEA